MDSINNIHPTAIIGSNVELGKNITIGPYCVLGQPGAIRDVPYKNGKIIIKDNTILQNFVSVMVGIEGVTVIGENNLIMNYVNIGHDVVIGDNNEIGPKTVLGGWSKLGNFNKLKIHCIIRNRIQIGNHNLIGMGSNVVKNISSHCKVIGNPAKIV